MLKRGFMMKRKALSILLVICLLASVISVCFVAPVSATKTEATTESATKIYESLASEPDVSLTFDGDHPYGIPMERYTSAFHYDTTRGCLVSEGGNWCFIGKNGDVGSTTLDRDSSAYSDLYAVENGKTYIVTFSIKALAGVTISTDYRMGFGVGSDPANAAFRTYTDSAASTYMTDIKTKNMSVIWNIAGVTQESGTIAQDTDWQTVYIKFTSKCDGYFGIHTYAANLAVDNLKIYNLIDSTFQDTLTFDNGGLAIQRVDSGSYAADTDGNNYAVFSGANYGSVYFASSEILGDVLPSSSYYNMHTTESGRTTLATAYANMYKFVPGETYEVSFDYRYAEGSGVTVGSTKPTLRLAADPGGKAHDADDILATKSWAKDISYTGLVLENEAGSGIWQTATVTFTVKTNAEIDYSSYGYIRADATALSVKNGTYEGDDTTSDNIVNYGQYNLTLDEMGGLYFGIRTSSPALEVDNYSVRKIVGTKTTTFSSTVVSLDFTGSTDVAPTVYENGTTTTFESDGQNEYMLVTSTGNARMSMEDLRVLEMGKKYYISFDAKTDTESTGFNIVIGHGSSSSSYRISLETTDAQNAMKNSGSVYYVNGKKVSSYSTFNSPTSEWTRYGFVLNLDESVWDADGDTSIIRYNDIVQSQWASLESGGGVYLLFGAGTFAGGSSGQSVCYDNITIVQSDALDDAVPETEGKVFTTVETVSHDMETETTSALLQNSTDIASFVDTEDDTYGTALKVSTSRVTFTDTNIIVPGYKYIITFDAKTDDTAGAYPWMIIGKGDTDTASTGTPRYIIKDATKSGVTESTTNCLSAFTFYKDGVNVGHTGFQFGTDWASYTVEFDYTNETFLSYAAEGSSSGQMGGLVNLARYFWIGGSNTYIDNLKIVKGTENGIKDNTEVSLREPSGSGTSYLSAGIRFRNHLPNDVVAAAEEIGFVVAPSTYAMYTEDWYKLENGVNSIARTVVAKDSTNNCAYTTDETNTYYQLVLTGLSSEDGKTAYNRRFSAVMYIKNTDGSYTYLALGETSYYNIVGIYGMRGFNVKLDSEEPLVIDDNWKLHPEDYKLVAFTFDDAPDSSTTRQQTIISTLSKYGGAGTFFVTGTNLNSYGYTVLQDAIDNGFDIGNHTYTHTNYYGNTTTTAEEYYTNELKTVNDLVYGNLYEADGVTPYTIKFTRSSNLALPTCVTEASETYDMPLIGRRMGNGELDSSVDNDTYAANVISNVTDGDFVLMHAWSDKSVETLDTVLEALYRKGYRFVTVSEMFEYKLKMTDFSQVDIANSVSSASGGIGNISQVVFHEDCYTEEQWFLHPEDYKLIAFTFDDGPSFNVATGDNQQTRVIKAFENYYGAGTFFFTGALTTNGAEIPKLALSYGHELGNHTLHGTLTSMTEEETIEQIETINTWYKENLCYTPTWFRGAGYTYNSYVWTYLASNNMYAAGYYVGFSDYSGLGAAEGSTAEKIIAWFNAQIDANVNMDGAIIGMHSTNSDMRTSEALATVLPTLYDEGYRFVTLSQLFEYKGITSIPSDKYINSIKDVIGGSVPGDAVAVQTPSESESEPQLNLSAEQVGDTVEVSVSVENNPGLTAFNFSITYDSALLTPASISNVMALEVTSNMQESGFVNNGSVSATYVDSTGFTGDGDIFKFVFNIAGTGEATFNIVTSNGSFVDTDLQTVTFTVTGDTVTLS